MPAAAVTVAPPAKLNVAKPTSATLKLVTKNSTNRAEKPGERKPFDQELDRAKQADRPTEADEAKPQQRVEQPKRAKRAKRDDAGAKPTDDVESRPATDDAADVAHDEPADDAQPTCDASPNADEAKDEKDQSADSDSSTVDASLIAATAAAASSHPGATATPGASTAMPGAATATGESQDEAQSAPAARGTPNAKTRTEVGARPNAGATVDAAAELSGVLTEDGSTSEPTDEANDATTSATDSQVAQPTTPQTKPAPAKAARPPAEERLAVQPTADACEPGAKENVEQDPGEIELPDFVERLSDAADELTSTAKRVASERSSVDPSDVLGADAPKPTSAAHVSVRAAEPAPLPPEHQFAADNHPNIVSSVRSTLLPNGGTMQIRLDPPDLGQLQISVSLRDGVMSASFETNNAEATRLLSHSLSQLKGVLESQGVSVDKLHVTQSPRNENTSSRDNDGSNQQQGGAQDSPARREQERRELLQRMWRKLTEGSDPLDMVA